MPDRSGSLELLRSRGIKATPQRQAILECVREADHPRADDIFARVSERFPGISLATVYNTLNTFVEHGLITQFPGEGGVSRFEWDTKPHYHVVCETCGSIQDFPPSALRSLEEAVADQTGFRIKGHRLEFVGVCQQCQDATGEAVTG